MKLSRSLLSGLIIIAFQSMAWGSYIAGFNLTESEGFVYDASATSVEPQTPAQISVDHAKRLGANHIILNVRAIMKGPYSTEIIPVTPPAERAAEAKRMVRLIKYIQSQGMTVGLRPIFFVVGPNGEFPYFEKQADGSIKTWWHGNIQPQDPNRWFESFRVYLDLYLTIAKLAKVNEFTIGAELYSMTVGIEDQWKEYPYGFPGRWLELLRFARAKLPTAKLMYDINFTDDSVTSSGIAASGGEFERWRYRLVDLANPTNPAELKIWNDLVSFWKELDYIGLDIYRSLASQGQALPSDYNDLVSTLKLRSDSYATQLDTGFMQIELTLDHHKEAAIKEIGFRSVDLGFIDPFAYAGTGVVNVQHQAASFQSVFESYWAPQWPWFKGVSFWDIAVDPTKQGTDDNGFSPVGKMQTENIIKDYYLKN